MYRYNNNDHALKNRLGNFVLFCASLFVPMALGFLITWKMFIAPGLDRYMQSIAGKIQGQLEGQLSHLQQVTEEHEKDIVRKIEGSIH